MAEGKAPEASPAVQDAFNQGQSDAQEGKNSPPQGDVIETIVGPMVGYGDLPDRQKAYEEGRQRGEEELASRA